LTTVLRSLDLPCSSLLGYEDVADWPEGALDDLVAAGLLRQAAHARSVVCDGCGEGCLEEVQFIGGDGEPLRAYVVCHGDENMGRVAVPLDRLWQ
jgi:hypothetical protein